LKWTETQVLSAFSPLERTLAISQGINSLVGNATDAKCELKWAEALVESGESPMKESVATNQAINSSVSQLTTDVTHPHSQLAQVPTLSPSQDIPPLTPEVPPKRPLEPLPEPQPPSPPPAPEEVLPSAPPPPTTAEPAPGQVPETITIEGFEFEGNTAISDEELAIATKDFINRPLAFAEVYRVRSVITELYRKRGYITSGAIIPPQTFKKTEGVVKIQVIEGGLEAIEVRGTRRLNPYYIRSRIALGAGTPLNRNVLIEALQLLQLDSLIKNLSAELTAGTRAGSSLLIVQVEEAKTLHLDVALNNNRSPNIGTLERRLELTQANLFGQGDGITVGYSNTNGSNTLDAIYTYPLNPRNGTLSFTTSFTFSNVVEPPFNRVDIDADSRYFALSYRQPLWRNLREEFALGISATNQRSKVTIFDVPVRLSPGTEEDGSTSVSAFRFFQDWIKRSNREVLALRSQFSLGVGFLGGTVNEDTPDSNFLAWRGQVQWLRVLAPNTLLLLRGDLQVSTNPLLRLEQFSLGGQDTIRGYRENVLLTDNGASASAELRFPILRLPKQNGLLQVGPFVDLGFVWNNSGNPDPEPDPNFLAAAGLGFRFQMGDRLSARLDWGFPIVDIASSERTLQENGVYFSVIYRIF
jgi:hemolysin activation/secretion protein